MTAITQQTLASIVTASHRTIPLLEKYQLDFCCKGKRTLADACREKGIDAEDIARQLEDLTVTQTNTQMPFTDMSATQLASYIETKHHFYVKQSMPVILAHLEKISMKHGDRFPYMREVYRLFSVLQAEMTQHLLKEETIVFPAIIQSGTMTNDGTTPLAALETEHEHAGDLMFTIRTLTNDYTPPPDACTTFRVTLAELREFEEDLHRHVHLENNVLFPLAERHYLHSNV